MADKEVHVSAEVWKAMAESYYKLWQETEKANKALNVLFDAHYWDLDDD